MQNSELKMDLCNLSHIFLQDLSCSTEVPFSALPSSVSKSKMRRFLVLSSHRLDQRGRMTHRSQ